MGKGQQRKGADGERELAEILNRYGYQCSRGGSLTFGSVPDLEGLPGIHIEVKRVEHLNIHEAMKQAGGIRSGSAVCLQCSTGRTGSRGL